MKIIVGKRASGRTTKLVKLFLKDDNGILFVRSPAAKNDYLKRLELNITSEKMEKIYWYGTNPDIFRGIDFSNKNIYCDDAEKIIETFFQKLLYGINSPFKVWQISAITLCSNEYEGLKLP